MTQYVDGLLAGPEAAAAPLIIGSVARLLAATVLTVFPSTIAYRWGFANASRFATWCQQAYGIRPSHTLRQG